MAKSCHHKKSCPLFPYFQLETSLKVWQIHYCDGQYQKCARFRLAEAGKPVAATLLPDGDSLLAAPKGGAAGASCGDTTSSRAGALQALRNLGKS